MTDNTQFLNKTVSFYYDAEAAGEDAGLSGNITGVVSAADATGITVNNKKYLNSTISNISVITTPSPSYGGRRRGSRRMRGGRKSRKSGRRMRGGRRSRHGSRRR